MQRDAMTKGCDPEHGVSKREARDEKSATRRDGTYMVRHYHPGSGKHTPGQPHPLIKS
jgi:hypothetical protein